MCSNTHAHTHTCHGVLGDDLPLDLLEEAGLDVVEIMFPHGEGLNQRRHLTQQVLHFMHSQSDCDI